MSLNTWTEHILPEWSDEIRKSSFFQHLCYSGIPDSVRGRTWKLLLGKPIGINPTLYIDLKCRFRTNKNISGISAVDTLNSDAYVSSQGSSHTSSIITIDYLTGRDGVDQMKQCQDNLSLISIDLPRTHLWKYASKTDTSISFDKRNPQLTCDAVINVLYAYVQYRPDIGYIQGMTYIASMLCNYMDEYDAFQCFAVLLNSRLLSAFYRLDTKSIQIHTDVFNVFFKYHIHDLHAYFISEQISCDMFLIDWYLTIFTKVLPFPTSVRIWDVFLLEGDVLLLRAALGVLRMFSSHLMSVPMEAVVNFLTRGIPEHLMKPHQLWRHISMVQVSPYQYERVMSRISLGKRHRHLQSNRSRGHMVIPSSSSSSSAPVVSAADDIPFDFRFWLCHSSVSSFWELSVSCLNTTGQGDADADDADHDHGDANPTDVVGR